MNATPTPTPGWVVDVLLAAADAAGVPVRSAWVRPGEDGSTEAAVLSLARQDVASAWAVFVVLGVVPAVSEPYGTPPQVNVEARVLALGGVLVTCYATQGLPPVVDVAVLVAAVDAAHADAGDPVAAVQAIAEQSAAGESKGDHR